METQQIWREANKFRIGFLCNLKKSRVVFHTADVIDQKIMNF